MLHRRRQRLNEIASGQRINGVRHTRLVGDDLLCPQGDFDCLFRRKGERLVHGVGVERLRSTQDARQGFEGGSDDVVLGLLGGQGAAGRLGVEPEHPGTGALCLVLVAHAFCPDAPRRPELRDLLEEVNVRIEEERDPRDELVDVQAALNAAST